MDNSEERLIQVQSKEDEKLQDQNPQKPTRKEVLNMMREMIKGYDHLPPHALYEFATHSDVLSLTMLVLTALESED